MKALTIWQPWATLIAVGAKPYEFRGWRVPAYVCGQRIAIHAGARPVKPAEVRALLQYLTTGQTWRTGLVADLALPLLTRLRDDPGCVPLSAILCTGVIGEARSALDVAREFGGKINDSDRDEYSNFAWPITEIEPLMPPQEARGAQGFWNWGGRP